MLLKYFMLDIKASRSHPSPHMLVDKGWGTLLSLITWTMCYVIFNFKWMSPPSGSMTKPPKPAIQWLSPSVNTLKWNMDASLSPLELKSSIGGVLRDHNNNFLCISSSPIPCVKINHENMLAIHQAIKIFMAQDNLKLHRLIVESDSANAVKWYEL